MAGITITSVAKSYGGKTEGAAVSGLALVLLPDPRGCPGCRRADQPDSGCPLLALQPPLLDRLGNPRIARRSLQRLADTVEDL